MNKPLIGVTTANRPSSSGLPFLAAYTKNITALEQAGSLPILIPCGLDRETLRAIYERVDGILLPGGSDIDPAHYGASPHPKTEGIDVPRDETEITLARWSAEDDRPLFGICRGHQLVNVALGGTLIQDIPDQVDTRLDHFPPSNVPRTHLPHEVRVEPGSLLARIVNTDCLQVNSLHHQAIEEPAPGLHITAHAPDGIIEAAELSDRRFYHTVQWHPEDLQHIHEMQQLFDALVKAARNGA